MLKGLAETEGSLRNKHIPFHLLREVEPRGQTLANRFTLPPSFFVAGDSTLAGFALDVEGVARLRFTASTVPTPPPSFSTPATVRWRRCRRVLA